MRLKIIGLSLAGLFMATTAHSVPVDAFSEVTYNHSFIINSGSIPTGLDFSLAAVLEQSVDADTQIDVPTTNLIDIPSVQVGQVTADPPVPYFARRGIAETTPDGTQAARASYNVNILQTNGDGGTLDFVVVERDVDNEGAAEFTSTDGSVSGAAASSFFNNRVYGYENVSAGTISFNLIGEFSAEVLANFEGGNGFARSSLNYGLEIDSSAGVAVTYLPLAPYLRDIEDSDPGAVVSESLDIGVDGFAFSASASAMSPGAPANASFEGGFRYALLFSMAPGSSFELTDRFSQTNAVEYRPQDSTSVPTPASLPLLLAGLCGLALRRRGWGLLSPGRHHGSFRGGCALRLFANDCPVSAT